MLSSSASRALAVSSPGHLRHHQPASVSSAHRGCRSTHPCSWGSDRCLLYGQGWAHLSAPSKRPLSRSLQAAETSSDPVFQGAYGRWTMTQDDVREVYGYRTGLSIAGLAVILSTLAALLPADGPTAELHSTLQAALNPLFIVGGASLGVSLVLIHIYLDFLKKTLQVLWAVGFTGGIYLISSQDVPAATYVAQHPQAVWLVGPLFAAVTGVAFKEGLCYGKAEAAALFFLVPLLLGGHLLQILPSQVEQVLLFAVAALFTVFAGRKWTQPIKDDLGDKSVFEMLKLPEAEQEALRSARSSRDS